MKPETISPRNQLGCNEGIEGAIEALADEGVAGVRVESLAKRFSVTKGKLLLALQGPPGSVQRHILQTWKEGRFATGRSAMHKLAPWLKRSTFTNWKAHASYLSPAASPIMKPRSGVFCSTPTSLAKA